MANNIKKKELIYFINRCIVNNTYNNDLRYCSFTSDVDSINMIISALLGVSLFDAPDGYYYDSDNYILYMFEHFEFDCSPRKKRSSSLRESISKANRIICNKSKDENETINVIEQGYSEYIDNKVIYHIGKNGDRYRDNYINNFNYCFIKHCKQIDNYKENCRKIIKGRIDKVITLFVIEDITLGGTYFLKDKSPDVLVNPLMTKQFMEALEDSNVDYLIFNSLHKPSMFSILDKKVINDSLKNKAIDLNSKEFFVFPAMPQFTFYKKI